MARVTNIPTIGRRTIFTAQTDRRAGIGRPDLRLSLISIRAKDTPKRIRVMGTVIAPISLAFKANDLSESVLKDLWKGEQTCVNNKPQRRLSVRTLP